MASLGQIFRPRPVLQFLHARSFRPLTARGLRTRPTPRPSQPRPSNPAQSNDSTPAQDGQSPPPAQPQQPNLSNMLATTSDQDNSLLAPVHIPEDPNSILKSSHPSTSLLTQSGIVVQRQIEMMNIFLGFEQANRYVIMDPQGNHIGYLAETDGGIAKSMTRQFARTHRAFTAHVFDRSGQEVLRFNRPFSWINTRIRVYDPVELAPGLTRSASTEVANVSQEMANIQQISSLKLEEMKIIGEAQSEWAPLRRKYNLFLSHSLPESQEIAQNSQDNFTQFAYIDEPFLSWDFNLKGADNQPIGSVNRNWGGLGREFFTDTGTYVLRMDSVGQDKALQEQTEPNQGNKGYSEALGGTTNNIGMTLDQRAVMLATAVTVDFDYFSRHSRSGGIMPIPFMMGGGGTAAEGGAAAGGAVGAGAGAEAGAIGETVSGGAVGQAGRAVGGAGVGEGAMAGAGTMAGYEAMQQGMGRRGGGDGNNDGQAPPPAAGADDASPQAPGSDQGYYADQSPGEYGSGFPQDPSQPQDGQGDVWGSGENDPYQGGGGDGGDGEGGIISKLWDMFNDE